MTKTLIIVIMEELVVITLITVIKLTHIDEITWKIKRKSYCSGPPAFKCQRVGHGSTQNLLHHYQHSQNQLNS